MNPSLPKQLLAFLLFFGLFYMEPVSIGPTTFAVLWKLVLVLAISVGFLRQIKGGSINLLAFWGLTFVVLTLANESLFIDPVETTSFTVKYAFIPLIYGFWLQRVRRSDKLFSHNERYIVGLSAFIILSTLPFYLHLISPLSTGYDLSIFEDELGDFGFVGIFQNAHGASVTLSLASATLLWWVFNKRSKGKRPFYFSLVAIGAASVVATLVRTGMAMFLAMVFVLLFLSTRRTKRSTLLIGLAVILGIALTGLYLFDTSELFKMRLLGENVYTQEQALTWTQIGSGRPLYWQTAIEHFFSAPAYVQILGFGPTLGKDAMLQAVGRRIYAHNGFIDILHFYGYLGLLAYLMMIRQVIKIILSPQHSDPYFALAVTHFVGYLAQMLVQGERFFLADVLFALVLVGAKVSGDRTGSLFDSGKSLRSNEEKSSTTRRHQPATD